MVSRLILRWADQRYSRSETYCYGDGKGLVASPTRPTICQAALPDQREGMCENASRV